MRMDIDRRSLLKTSLALPAGVMVLEYLDNGTPGARAEQAKAQSIAMPF